MARSSSGLNPWAAPNESRIDFTIFRVVEPERIQPDSIYVVSINEHIHRVERNVHYAIAVVIGFLHAGLHHADHLKGNAIEANGLAERRHSRKQLILRFRAQNSVKTMAQIIFIVYEAALLYG